MATHFRPATTADIPAIAAMWHAGWHDGHAAIVPDDLTALRVLDSFVARATAHLPATIVNDHVTAMVMIEGDELYQVYVAPAARGTGTAAAIMAHAEDIFRTRGIIRPWLACSVGNDRAARFYEKCGWERMGVKDITVETSGDPYTLPVWRYEKDITYESA